MEPDTVMSEAGEHTYLAKFIPTDSNNYKTVENISIIVKVSGTEPSATPAPSDGNAVVSANTSGQAAGTTAAKRKKKDNYLKP